MWELQWLGEKMLPVPSRSLFPVAPTFQEVCAVLFTTLGAQASICSVWTYVMSHWTLYLKIPFSFWPLFLGSRSSQSTKLRWAVCVVLCCPPFPPQPSSLSFLQSLTVPPWLVRTIYLNHAGHELTEISPLVSVLQVLRPETWATLPAHGCFVIL